MAKPIDKITQSTSDRNFEAGAGATRTGQPAGLAGIWERLSTSDAVRFISLTAQLGLVMLALWRFRIEDDYGFIRLLPLIFGGFIVHSLLPMRYRRAFFLTLSIAAIGVVLPFPQSLVLVGLGLGLIGLCHLPVAFSIRVGLILMVVMGLATLRTGWISNALVSDFQTLILPVLGAMFMFRLAIYLYDIRHEKQPASISERLSYFFLLPNISFLLFPVVDYRTYRRTYYNEQEHVIYQRGVLWMVRGLTHLLLYRLVYQYLVPSPGDVQSLTAVMQFMVTSYLLYLRISGQFHMIIGILCLFGFNLPETHHLYYLASSFNDFWRRINIYWKDFMMKMVYYPAFMRLRKWGGMSTGIVLATVVVFTGTWLLHSYQWFWLRGAFPLAATDGLFWGFLGVMVVINSLQEARGKKKKAGALNLRVAFVRSAKTVGFFTLMSLLWSFWSTATPGEWLAIVSNAGRSSPAEFGKWALVFLGAIIIGMLVQYALRRDAPASRVDKRPLVAHPGFYTVAVASLLILVSLPQVRGLAGSRPEGMIQSLRNDRLNMRDRELADRGYYEGLLDHGNFTSALWTAHKGRPRGREWAAIRSSNVVDLRDDFFEYELKASWVGTFKDAPFVTNSWRMRDSEYEQVKAAGTYRTALLGASYEMGAGVGNDQTYEAVLEERLNQEMAGQQYTHYEILNFAVGGYSMIQKLMVAETSVPTFDPDLVVMTVYSTEENRVLNQMGNTVLNRRPIPFPFLEDVVRRSGARADMDRTEIRDRLRPYLDEIIAWSFRKMREDSEAQGYPLLTLFMPATTDKGNKEAQERLAELWQMARDAGLNPAMLDKPYGTEKMEEIQLAPWDHHLNVKGNQLVANALFEQFVKNEPLLLAQGALAGSAAATSR